MAAFACGDEGQPLVSILEMTKMDEKTMEKKAQQGREIFDARRLDAAKNDLIEWKSINEERGESKPSHPTYKPRKSCQLFGDNCQSYGLGECLFYTCYTRPNYQEWLEHHKHAHPKNKLQYNVLCNVCKRIHDEETRFMEGRIFEFEKNLNNVEMPKESPSTIESTVEAGLSSILAEEELFEGKKVQRFTNYYERNPKLRKKAIEIHGFKCMACGFEFVQKYGERGSKFIEVHHLNPVSSLDEATPVDPKTEMAVVCSNCHRMIHLKKDKVLSLEELRKIIR